MLVDILLTIHFILLVLISLRVLARHDLTAPARLAWLVILFLLPYFGVLVYWMFGEVHLGRNFTRERQKIIDKLHRHRPEVLGSDMAYYMPLSLSTAQPLLIQQKPPVFRPRWAIALS